MTQDVAQAVARLLRDLGTGLDDDLVQLVRAIMAEPVAAPPPPSDVLDRGGAELQEGSTTSVQGGVTIGDQGQTIREQVVG